MDLIDLHGWLLEYGFTIGPDPLRAEHNQCEWYAWRMITIPVIGRPGDNRAPNLFVYPFKDGEFENVEVRIVERVRSIWFQLMVYGLHPQQVVDNLNQIEGQLVAAWNAIGEITK